MPADKLNIGSRIATPRKLPAFGEESLKECEIKLLAYLIAEGHLSNRFILFSNKDEKIVNDFKFAVNDFDGNLKIKKHSKSNCFRVIENKKRIIIKQASRDSMGRFNSKPITDSKSSLRKWLDNIGIYNKLSNEKFVPKSIFKLPKNKLSLFINRLFSCDGSIYKQGPSYWKISYSSSSKRLAREFSKQCRSKKVKLPYFQVRLPLKFETILKFFADTMRSDHAPFWRANIPALMITDTANFRCPYYHTEADTIDKLDFIFMKKVIQVTLATTIEMLRKKALR